MRFRSKTVAVLKETIANLTHLDPEKESVHLLPFINIKKDQLNG